ncbi:hypothetical protein BGZ68_004384 [Mortierella alpina]|nr:hypothetical protein BGZ68_004384 [Mortierella alpina]
MTSTSAACSQGLESGSAPEQPAVMAAFTPAEAAMPQFKIHQETFMFMNQQPVYVQVTALDSSAWIWISAGANPLMQQHQQFQGGPSAASAAGGAFGDFAMAMPAFRPGQPAVSSTLLGNPIDETAAQMARRLATRFKRQFLVNVDIPATSDNAMLLAFAERKLTDMLRDTVFSNTAAATSS